MSVTLLIDADIVAYMSAAGNQQKHDWGDTGGVVVDADFDAACEKAKDAIEELADHLKATKVIICLSDDFENFRKKVDPTYKTNRTGERPVHLYDVKDWLRENYEVASIPTLEADDVMGIMATEPHEGKRIIVSEDKDMQTIPAYLYNPNKPKLKVRRITPHDAQRFMLWQAICGDTTDGYGGCPKAGPKAADDVLDGLVWRLHHREMKSGPRKGQVIPEWRSEFDPSVPLWDRIVSLFERHGQTEALAIRQVNLARILKNSDYRGGRVIPWTPSQIKGN